MAIYDNSLLLVLLVTWFQIFHTPEGMLSTEQGVYVAKSVASKNTRQAKGRFRMYDDEDSLVHLNFAVFFAQLPSEFWLVILCYFDQDHVRSNHSVKRDQPNKEAAGAGKRDTGKATKKPGKCCTCLWHWP